MIASGFFSRLKRLFTGRGPKAAPTKPRPGVPEAGPQASGARSAAKLARKAAQRTRRSGR